MNFRKSFLFGVTLILSLTSSAQNENQECDRLKFMAGEALLAEDYEAAAMYYLKAEIICDDFNKLDWERLLGSLKYVINIDRNENDERKNLYSDTLLNAWDRQEAAGFYDEMYDLERGLYCMQSTQPDAEKADMYFQRGIQKQGVQTPEAYIVYAYYTTYMMFSNAKGDKQAELKTRMISDYLFYTELVEKAGESGYTQISLNSYFDYIAPDCDDFLPEIQGYIETLPADTVDAIKAIQQMTKILEEKECTESNEYRKLIDAWLKLDPNSLEANYKKDPSTLNEMNSIEKINYLEGKITDPETLAELQYNKAYIQFKSGQYHAAYSTGRICTGEYKLKGLYIASQCVAATANNCGETTFERKCNYLYAAQLADEAGQENAAIKYRTKGPSTSDCSPGNMEMVYLNCWGVTVNYCH